MKTSPQRRGGAEKGKKLTTDRHG